jgi:hypothetical protein
MAIDFSVKDVVHSIAAKFVPAWLPDSRKQYNLKAAHLKELDIHEIASKAEVYNISTSPKTIENGFTAAVQLMSYLAADGYKLKTDLFSLSVRIPGEYNGSETRLPDGVYPEARIQVSAQFRKYLRDRVEIEFDGQHASDGVIGQVTDEATGLMDEAATIGNILTIHGSGLKIEEDGEHEGTMGVFFKPATGVPIKASIIAVNEPKTLKVLVPAELTEGTSYRISVETQSSARGSSTVLKHSRDMRSEFTVTALKG